MTGLINFYIVSTVHLKNVEILAQSLPDWDFRLLYEDYNPWINGQILEALPFESVAFSHDNMPNAIWQGQVDLLIFSTAQPRAALLSLLHDAFIRQVSTLAIEETMQISLNQGRVNNYVLPVDLVLAASNIEKTGMVRAGISQDRIIVTGWPFYTGKTEQTTDNERQHKKQQLGLDVDRSVAALTLTGLNEAGESPSVRRQQLRLAAQGLPEGFQLVVKPHPSEHLDVLMPFIQECAPDAVVVDGMVSVHDLLCASDVLLNRGVSQVCIEALLSQIPVVVLETGVSTPFHQAAPDVVVKKPNDLKALIARLFDGQNWHALYETFRTDYLPYTTDEARYATCRQIIACAHKEPQRPGVQQWFELALLQGWRFDRYFAVNMLNEIDAKKHQPPVAELRKLLHYCATRNELDVLMRYVGQGFFSDVLKCLWIDQMVYQRGRPQDEDVILMDAFPPALNAVWFIPHVQTWIRLLFGCKNHEAIQKMGRNVQDEFLGQVPGMSHILEEIDLFYGDWGGRMKLRFRIYIDYLKTMTRPLRQGLKTALKK